MPCTCPFSSSSMRSLTSPSMPSCSASEGYGTERPHASASMSGRDLMYSSETGLYSGFGGGGGAAGSGTTGPLPDLDGSIIVVLPTGIATDESPSVVDDMVTPNTGLGGSLGGSGGGLAFGGGGVGGGSATLIFFGITLRSGGGGGPTSAFGGGGGTRLRTSISTHDGRCSGRAGTCASPYAMPACAASATTTATRSGFSSAIFLQRRPD